MADGPTAEQKMSIATYFVMSSPTGELPDVLKDVTKLVSDPATLTDDAMTRIIKEYNHEQMAFGPHPNAADQLAMVSAFGMLPDGRYFNPVTNQAMTFDHKSGRFTAAADVKSGVDAGLNKYRVAVQKAVDSYIDLSYKAGKVCAMVYAGENGRLTICISAKNVHLGNFWTGGWRSCYGVDLNKQGGAELKGTIKIGVHYFEDGNVQLHSNFDQTAKVNITAKEEETGQAIAAAVAKIENDFHAHLEEMYVKMHTTTFKAMRRVLTIQKQHMNWNVAAHAMAAEVQSNKSQG